MNPPARRALLLVVLLLLVPAVAALFTDASDRTRRENRTLATWPAWNAAEGLAIYFRGLEAWVDDHMGFVGPVNELYRRAQFYLFRDRPVPNVDVAAEGFVFLNAHTAPAANARYRDACQPDPDLASNVAGSLAQFAGRLQERGVGLTVAIVPSKVLLYPERLPSTVSSEWRQACRSLQAADTLPAMVGRELEGAPLTFVFPIEEMAALKNEPDFYPPGNFHAVGMSAHVFAKHLMGEMGIDPGEAYDAHRRYANIPADLLIMGFRRKAMGWRYGYPSYGVKGARRQPQWVKELFPATDDFSRYETAHPASDRSVLMLSNSFGLYMTAHLAPGVRRLQHVSMNGFEEAGIDAGLESLIERSGATDVVILLHDGGFNPRLLQNLADALAPR